MQRITLNGSWQGRYAQDGGLPVEFPALVPGCAHTDLLREGRIPDYMYMYNVRECRFIEDAHFVYEKRFDWDGDGAEAEAILHFECLDTFCDVFLNGNHLGFCDNMFLPWRFDVTVLLKRRSNCLRVSFLPPAKQVEGYPEYPAAFTAERVHIRRMQCTFGWDWVDRFVTVGIQGNVFLEWPARTELTDLHVSTTALDVEGAELYLETTFSHVDDSSDCWLELTVDDPEGAPIWSEKLLVVEDTVRDRISVASPQLWYPAGYGEQPLYTLRATVTDEDGAVLSERECRFGIRTIRILEVADAPGSPEEALSLAIKNQNYLQGDDRNTAFSGFTLLCNGVRIFCKGANWVPCQPFPSLAVPERYRELLTLGREAGINMLRIWGGGLFEKEVFYETCDRLGILVTQDFTMACARYPEDQPEFIEQIRREAEHNVRRRRNHPCIAWWTGDNENSADGDRGMRVYNGRRVALTVIEPVLRRLDPTRRFQPSSPYGGTPFKSATRGTTHGTFFIGPLFTKIQHEELADYHDMMEGMLSRFNCELPLMGLAPVSSLRRFLDEDSLLDDDALRFHTKNNPSPEFANFTIYDAMVVFAEKLLGPFRDEGDKLYKMQYLQYEWLRHTLEIYRRNKWYSSGALYWMFNDCWAAVGWSMIDYYCVPKGGYYAMKSTGSPLITSIRETPDGRFSLHLISDALDAGEVQLRLYLQGMREAAPLWEERLTAEVRPNSSALVWEGAPAHLDAYRNGEAVLLCDLCAGEHRLHRSVLFPRRISDLHLPGEAPEIVGQSGDSITLRAEGYVHAVGLDGDYVFADNHFIMTPGEERTIGMRPTMDAAATEIALYCL